MKLFKLIFVSLFISVILGACAAPNTTKLTYSNLSNSTINPNENKALIYFLRPNMLGWPFHAAIYDGSDLIGFVPHNGQLPYLAAPGDHLFMITGESADFMKAELLEGKTYYVQAQPRMGVWKARFSLIPVVQQNIGSPQVQEWLANAKMVENNDAAYEWAEENREKEMQKRDKYYKKWMEKPEEARPFLRPEDGI